MTQKGYIVLLDLSGYTEFLTKSELDAVPGILQSLVGTLLEHVEPPLEVAELEGDAVFAYAPEGSFRRGQTLLEVIERLYCVFAAAREQMEHNAACDCSGCKRFPKLDLKVVAHYGSFVLSRMMPERPPKPVGPDVVLAHRLLKNRVVESTGFTSYAFITRACADSLGLDWLERHAKSHSETYDHVGEVQGYVHDMAPVWARDRENKLVSIEAGDAWIQIDTQIAAPAQVVWDALTAPEFKTLWRFADQVTVTDGRAGKGTEYRCYRGQTVSVDKVVDWQPFRRLTLDCEWPLGARLRMTTELAPGPAGTQLVTRLGMPSAATPVRDFFVRMYYRLRSGRIESQCRALLERLNAQVATPSMRQTPH
jgi:uncharacterized protein YndB with AHSA1/START domain